MICIIRISIVKITTGLASRAGASEFVIESVPTGLSICRIVKHVSVTHVSNKFNTLLCEIRSHHFLLGISSTGNTRSQHGHYSEQRCSKNRNGNKRFNKSETPSAKAML